METFTDAIGLRRHGLGFRVIDVVDRQVKLVIVMINSATVFCTSVGQDAQHGKLMRLQRGLQSGLDLGLASHQTQTCEVLNIYDGDTMTVSCSGHKSKLRLYCIDTPEMQQKPWGRQSRDYLRGITPPSVRMISHDTDRYGRVVAEVFAGDTSLNLQMVKAGQAAVYRRYCNDSAYYDAQQQAQSAELGIWSQEGLQQRPWEWRRNR